MRIDSPLPPRRARIEIIPLIDIMFFLLAAFMMVSIGKVHLRSLKVNLPTDVPAAQKEKKEDFIVVSVGVDGQIQFDRDVLPDKNALTARLQAIYATNKEQKFMIAADKDTSSGDLLAVLGKVRSVGFQKVAFSTKPQPGVVGNSASSATAPDAAVATH